AAGGEEAGVQRQGPRTDRRAGDDVLRGSLQGVSRQGRRLASEEGARRRRHRRLDLPGAVHPAGHLGRLRTDPRFQRRRAWPGAGGASGGSWGACSARRRACGCTTGSSAAALDWAGARRSAATAAEAGRTATAPTRGPATPTTAEVTSGAATAAEAGTSAGEIS